MYFTPQAGLNSSARLAFNPIDGFESSSNTRWTRLGTYLRNSVSIKLFRGYNHHMPRKARIDAPRALLHVIVRGIERRKIFKSGSETQKTTFYLIIFSISQRTVKRT